MLDHLRKQVTDALAQATRVTLTTHGIAGLQTSVLPCESAGLRLYLAAPATCGHLVNVEDNPLCVVVTEQWELRGLARRVTPAQVPSLGLLRTPGSDWNAWIEISPTRLQILSEQGSGYATTIDMD
jgi:hypothetical protein